MVKIDIPMPKSCEDCPIYYDGYCCPLIEVKDDD